MHKTQKKGCKLLSYYIVKIQSSFRGYYIRNKFSKNKSFFNSSLLLTTQNLTYSFLKNKNLITNDEIHYLFGNYPQINKKLSVICLKSIEYSNGCQYYGEWNEAKNQKEGRGIQKWPEGPTYYGYFKEDKANGKGKLIFKEGEVYEGDWMDNRANGYGIFLSEEVKYEGNWKNDNQHGIGIEKWNDGNIYIGEFCDGQKTGEGKFIYIDGSVYMGSFLNNNFHGKGKYKWADVFHPGKKLL